MAPRRSSRIANISKEKKEELHPVKIVKKLFVQRTNKRKNSSKDLESVAVIQQQNIFKSKNDSNARKVVTQSVKQQQKHISASVSQPTTNYLVKSLKNDTKIDKMVTRSSKKASTDVETKPNTRMPKKELIRQIHFKRNDICFAKMTGHAPWPAQVILFLYIDFFHALSETK